MATRPRWEVAELVAALDATIVPRLRADHPEAGWCRRCHVNAPCPSRTLADAAFRAAPDGADGESPTAG